MHELLKTGFLGLLLAAISGSVYAQTNVWTHTTSGVFIDDITVIPEDLDGDGINDVAYYDASNNSYTFLSAANGNVIITVTLPVGDLTLPATYAFDNKRFLPVGDVDGNGSQNVWIHTQAGARIVDAVTGQSIWSMPAIAGVSEFFRPLAIGDVDFDGADDLLFRALSTNGVVFLMAYSINLDSQLYALAPFAPTPIGVIGDMVGAIQIGDIDGDGVSDIAVADHFVGNAGTVTVFSGATGATLTVLVAPTGVARWGFSSALGYGTYGCSIAAVGDHDGDGIPDIGVFEGAVANTLGGAGEFRIHSLPSGQLISHFEWPYPIFQTPIPIDNSNPFAGPYHCTGAFFYGFGDVNRDGVGDFFIDRVYLSQTTPSDTDGTLVNGDTGDAMRFLIDSSGLGPNRWTRGTSAVDINGDSIKEVLLVRNNYPGFTTPGAPADIRLVDPTVRGVSTFGEACNLNPASTQVPRIGLDVNREIGAVTVGDTVIVNLSNVPVGHRATLLFGTSNTMWGNEVLPLAIGSTVNCQLSLLVSPDQFVPRFTAARGLLNGWTSVSSGVIPASLIGSTVYAQWFVEDIFEIGLAAFSASQGMALEL